MSSGGWEIVCKKSKEKTNGKTTKLTKAEKKLFLVNAPKFEDILPLDEVKALYDCLDNNKENKKPSKEKDSKSKENEEKKKQQKLKQQQQQQAEKNKKQQQQKAKERLPKSEKGQTGVNIDEINELLEKDKAKFPTVPVIWIKDLISYLDAKLPVEKGDPGYQSKPDSHPVSLISKAVRATFEETIKSVGPHNLRLCWEETLGVMIKNISNGTSDTGCKIFLQLSAQIYPEMTIENIPKLASLRNSYQNKKPIGLSLLWAFAQSGKKNLSIGLTIWHEIMAPMLESRSYASYVIKILNDLLNVPKNVNNLTAERYLEIVEDFFSGKINIPTIYDKEIAICMQSLRLKMIKSELINVQKMFETLMGKITPKMNVSYREEIIRALVDCLSADARCLSVWTNLYPKHFYQSDLLLKQLLANWNTLRSSVDPKPLKAALENFRALNIVPKKGKEEHLILSCERTTTALVEKMSAARKRESSFPWKKGSLVLLLLIGALVAFDCQKHGSFEASTIGKYAKNSGAIQYGENALSLVNHYKDKSLHYLETSYPEYYSGAVDFTNKYYRLVGDFCLITRNISVKLYLKLAHFVGEKKPLVAESFEHYFPGLLEDLHKRVLDEIERVKTYSAIVGEHVLVKSTSFVRWLETSVFVGQLSPENLSGYATQAVDTTQKFASQTYDWIYEKVQTLSKVQ